MYQEAVASGIVLTTIGVGRDVNMNELRQITNDPDLNFYVDSFATLASTDFIDAYLNTLQGKSQRRCTQLSEQLRKVYSNNTLMHFQCYLSFKRDVKTRSHIVL